MEYPRHKDLLPSGAQDYDGNDFTPFSLVEGALDARSRRFWVPASIHEVRVTAGLYRDPPSPQFPMKGPFGNTDTKRRA